MGSSPPPSGYSTSEPEILPPARGGTDAGPAGFGGPVNDFGRPTGAGVPVPETRRRSGSRSWAHAPATYLLLGINVLVYLWMVVSGVSFTNPSLDQLVHFGANNAMLVLYHGDWFRIVTAMFVHVGLIHLASNMWCLWNLGLLGEPLIGPVGVFAAYILSGAAGNLLSVGYNLAFGNPGSVGAGASGAVFGLAGVLILLLKSPRLPIPAKELSGLRRNVIYFAAINFVIGFGGNALGSRVHIDNMAHLGGFLGGLLFAVPLVPLIGSPRPMFFFRRRVAIGLVTAVLVFFGVYLSNAFPPERAPAIEQQ